MTPEPRDPIQVAERVRISVFNPLHAVQPEDSPDGLYGWAVDTINAGRALDVVHRLENHPSLPSSSLLGHILGNALKYIGEFDKAEVVLQRALSMRRQEFADAPTEASRLAVAATLSVLGEVAFCRRKYDESERRFVEAIDIVPTFWIPHCARLCLASMTRDPAYCHRVIDDMERAIPTFLDNSEIKACLASDGQLHFVRTLPELWSRVSAA